jgi:hypothetical protein
MASAQNSFADNNHLQVTPFCLGTSFGWLVGWLHPITTLFISLSSNLLRMLKGRNHWVVT